MFFRVFSLLLFVIVPSLTGLPQQTEEQDGPCTGMNCLHGVLMHNDGEQGDEHKAEDQYLRFKETLDTGSVVLPCVQDDKTLVNVSKWYPAWHVSARAKPDTVLKRLQSFSYPERRAGNQPEIGTKAAEDQLHNMLMHNGEDAHHEDVADVLPELNVEKGPIDPNEFLHETMHGEEGTNKHDWDSKAVEVPVLHEPMNGDKLMHDLLMHGGEQHYHDNKNKESEEIENVRSGPEHGEELMHGLLMHGDRDHKHESDSDTKTENAIPGKIQPLDAEGYLHGVLMHGDGELGHDHDRSDEDSKENEKLAVPAGPRSDDLHGILMHGDSEFGKDHSHEDSDSSEKSEPFSDILEILNMELDEQLLRVIDIEKLIKQDIDEYKEWIQNNPQYQDDTLSGSTNIGVTDSILNDIELMKNRYLKSSSEQTEESQESDEFPFTADDAKEILKPGSADKDEGEDMRHYLELIGSTEPLNSRHKVKLDLLKSKLNDEH